MNHNYTENILEAPLDETVCWCSGVSKGKIFQAVEQGAMTLDQIRQKTSACTVGRCIELSPRGRCCSREIKLLIEAGIK